MFNILYQKILIIQWTKKSKNNYYYNKNKNKLYKNKNSTFRRVLIFFVE
jgi:hypothetical protein